MGIFQCGSFFLALDKPDHKCTLHEHLYWISVSKQKNPKHFLRRRQPVPTNPPKDTKHLINEYNFNVQSFNCENELDDIPLLENNTVDPCDK